MRKMFLGRLHLKENIIQKLIFFNSIQKYILFYVTTQCKQWASNLSLGNTTCNAAGKDL